MHNLIDAGIILNKFGGITLDEHGDMHRRKMLLQDTRHRKGKDNVTDAVGAYYQNALNFSLQSC
jgi:hypothetical protein